MTMACSLQTNENKSPLSQKRCSLPGPIGPLNLYPTHNQRRLSERGLIVYKPNKPDIDLIRDFNANHRKNSTPILKRTDSSGPLGQSSSLSAGPSSGVNYGRRNSSYAAFPSCASNATIPESGITTTITFEGSGDDDGSEKENDFFIKQEKLGDTLVAMQPKGGGRGKKGGPRKVRLRIQRNPGAASDQYQIMSVEKRHKSIPGKNWSLDEIEEPSKVTLRKNPMFEPRRFSDSAAFGIVRNAYSDTETGTMDEEDSGIVCTMGDLVSLKCLNSSAQEIRMVHYDPDTCANLKEDSVVVSPHSNRSRSFDATLTMRKKGAGSSWFNRRHLPIAIKFPNNMEFMHSPSIPSSPGICQPSTSQLHQHQVRTPLLTVTNENDNQSEVIEIPSPPPATPASSTPSPAERVKVPWNTEGFVLDAAMLGAAIENHLKKGDFQQRRATVCTLYQSSDSTVETKVTTRARSASACVIPVTRESDIPHLLKQSGRRESQPGSISAFNQTALTRLSNLGGKSPVGEFGEPITSQSFYSADCIDEECSDDDSEKGKVVGSSSVNSGSKLSSKSYVPSGNNNGCTNNGKFYERMNARANNNGGGRSTSSSGNNSAGGITICGAIRDFLINTLRP